MLLKFSPGIMNCGIISNCLNTGKAKIIYTLAIFLHLQQSCCDVDSITWNFLGSEGLSLPKYTERILVNDVTLFYYDSSMKSTAPCPEWLDTTAGLQHCKETRSLSDHNRENMALALQNAISQFNLTGTISDINVYQGYSRCDLYPNGTVKAFFNSCIQWEGLLKFRY
ncbi:hypothetical protein PHYPO_G00170590 [Pangasianodon hypophthalmus]|uniref:MHC class I-like antigen recognition-like domain-containing protein n=1 Tax=Pangasianodon hypophthalmus TaxID=310915 RepID=A0A5N5JJT3_PANHP|nr:hypothetical protein PHYPO_G00170590 [Pangasianodon hypophthalmus]